MRIGILGATSHIAKDLIASFSAKNDHELVLFARRPQIVGQWLARIGMVGRYSVSAIDSFGPEERFDAILNFVGVGNPAQANALGSAIFDVTLQYDGLALEYVRRHPACRYVFMSSGAAYGSSFDEPASDATKALVALNGLRSQDWYGVAKLHAECRHRSLSALPIVDLRIFNYFSHTQDISARFLVSDALRAIKSGEVLITSRDNIMRDYLGPNDFHQLVSLVLAGEPANDVVDCYTLAPIDKSSLLTALKDRFGLAYEVLDAPAGIDVTGLKRNYYSNNRKAATLGYVPTKTSLENILDETEMAVRQ